MSGRFIYLTRGKSWKGISEGNGIKYSPCASHEGTLGVRIYQHSCLTFPLLQCLLCSRGDSVLCSLNRRLRGPQQLLRTKKICGRYRETTRDSSDASPAPQSLYRPILLQVNRLLLFLFYRVLFLYLAI
jgi:hypothetical protein